MAGTAPGRLERLVGLAAAVVLAAGVTGAVLAEPAARLVSEGTRPEAGQRPGAPDALPDGVAPPGGAASPSAPQAGPPGAAAPRPLDDALEPVAPRDGRPAPPLPGASPVPAAPPLPGTPPGPPGPPGPPPARPPADLFVAVGGSGDCSRDDPCAAFESALRRASPGDVVEVLGGDHGTQKLRRAAAKDARTPRVVFRGAADGSTRVRVLDLEVPATEWTGLHVTGEVRVRETAAGTVLRASRVDGLVDVQADGTQLLDNRIDGSDDRDAVHVRSGPDSVVLRGNVVGPADRTGSQHVDCLQVVAATRLRVEANTFFQCATQSIHLKPDRGPIVDVLLRDNAVQGCVPRDAGCDGYNALSVRTAGAEIRDVRIEHNTVHGGVAVDDVPGLQLRRNVMTAHPGCLAAAVDNVFGAGGCGSDAARGNTVRRIAFVAPAASPPDLRTTAECGCAGYGADR